MKKTEEYFRIPASNYDPSKNFYVVRASSLDHPKNNSIMFITLPFMKKWRNVLCVNECIVIWPKDETVPEELLRKHVVILSEEPRFGFAEFFYRNKIMNNPNPNEYEVVNGAYICNGAQYGTNTTIFPGVYMDSRVVVGNNCYVGSGVKLIGNVIIGDDCIIKENTVVGSDGLTTRRNSEGVIYTIPQFGGVKIEDNVHIGANSVICRGAIDDTIIETGTRIDNCCFISHNVHIGRDVLIVGETLMMGSSSAGNTSYISGNSVIRDGVSVGERSFVGMGSVVTKNIDAGLTVMGNPARCVL